MIHPIQSNLKIPCVRCGKPYELHRSTIACGCGEVALADSLREVLGRLVWAAFAWQKASKGQVVGRYTEADVEVLELLRSEPADMIARKLNRSLYSVWSFRSRRRLQVMPHWSSAEDLFLKTHQHLPWPVVAQQLNRSTNGVRCRARRIKVQGRTPDSVKTQELILPLVKQGIGHQDIARQTGYSRETVRRVMREAGYPSDYYLTSPAWRDSAKRKEKCRLVALKRRRKHA